jgi:hypothetical protein
MGRGAQAGRRVKEPSVRDELGPRNASQAPGRSNARDGGLVKTEPGLG